MYIKQIKAVGFKSFADRINLEFNKNFTGIVGPNGSGKSNIVDAVKWVLGEQSVKTLRGSGNMTDVIFSGSKSRKPSSSASVSIVFDNSDKHLPIDYDEVSIKRVVYNSGDNEYFLNGSKCRLKDITDLFVDSFSSKESINIISQGKVDNILLSKPEERRTILEEAAGVLKYKKRKEETLRKLAKTHENIDRIDLILDELSVNLEPLKLQAEEAKKYEEVQSKLRNIEITLSVLDIEKFNSLFKTGKEKQDDLNKKIIELNKTISKNEVALEKLKTNELKIDDKLNDINNSLFKSNELLRELGEKKELSKERSKYNSKDVKVQNNLIDKKEKLLKLDGNIKLEENEIKTLTKELEKTKEELENNKNELDILLKEEHLLNNEINNLNKKRLEFKNKIELIENNINNSLRVPYSVKSVLDNPKLSGIKNTIGNVIEVEEKYSTMLDTSLGYASNFVITSDEECAKEAVNYLKKNKIGRVTFFPLSVIKPKFVEKSVLNEIENENGFIDVASNLVNYNTEYENIVKNQLGNILVVETLDDAVRIGRKISNKYRIVSLDGEIIHVGGSLTGGSNNKNSVIGDKFELGRINNLNKSNDLELESKETELKDISYNISVLRDKVLDLNSKLEINNELINNKNMNLNDIKQEQKRVKNEIDMLTSKDLNNEFDKLMVEFYKEDTKNKKIIKDLETEKEEKERISNEIILLEKEIKTNNIDYNNLNQELKDTEIECVKTESIIDNLLNILNETYNLTFESAKEEVVDLNEEEARVELKELKRKFKSFRNVNIGSIEEYERINKRYEFLNSGKNDLLESEKNLLDIISEMDEVMEDKFIETFKKVNQEFNNVFKKLFNGGEACLELTDPDNYLETGIDINATPPGKKLTNISLLSGGEKTLTAISLLFAIMNLNNVPFAILDEVEAALDEANAVRFGEYLDNYKGKTQLLVITHQKKTMEYVDLLYGITMQESGVSKVVSVKLEDVK